MTNDHHDIVPILIKYALHQLLSEPEERALALWRQRSMEHALLPERFRDKTWLTAQRQFLHPPPEEAMWADIRAYIEGAGEPTAVMEPGTKLRIGTRLIVLRWYAAAVLLVFVMGYGGARWTRDRPTRSQTRMMTVLPSGCKILLTLGDGSRLGLDTLPVGEVVAIDLVRLRKTDSNSYVYTAGEQADLTVRHRLTLAAGAGVMRIQWPDGSSAWLKPGSDVEYSVDPRQTVTMVDGEAWFRVAADPDRPMTAQLADGAVVRVLGTSFDVHSSPFSTTNRVVLFSGKVRVVKNMDSVVLRPGFQVGTSGQALAPSAADSVAALAWLRPAVKDSDFLFENVDLLQLMPAIASWFRVTVINPQQIRGERITGDFLRTMPLPVLIDNIARWEAASARIDLRNDTIYILPPKPGG